MIHLQIICFHLKTYSYSQQHIMSSDDNFSNIKYNLNSSDNYEMCVVLFFKVALILSAILPIY